MPTVPWFLSTGFLGGLMAALSGFVMLIVYAVQIAQGAAAFDPGQLLALISGIVQAVAGVLLAWLMYGRRPVTAEEIAVPKNALHSLLLHKYYVDELYDAAIRAADRKGRLIRFIPPPERSGWRRAAGSPHAGRTPRFPRARGRVRAPCGGGKAFRRSR